MKQMRKKAVAIFLTCVLTALLGLSAFGEEAPSSGELAARYVKDTVDEVVSRYRFSVTEKELYERVVDYLMGEHPELLEGALRAATDGLDNFSGYFSREELLGFGNYIEQNYVGIGIEIRREPGRLEIVGVLANSPAKEAGLLPGDWIVEINGEDATNDTIETASQKVRGEVGTTVDITVLRDDQRLSFTIPRAKVYNETVDHQILENGIGYMQISQFNSTTPAGVQEALAAFDAAGVKRIIADVRGNPGGELQSVLRVLYQIVPSRMPLTTIDYNGEERDVTFQSNADFETTDRRYVVLIDEDTASAAELFTGAIRGNGLGIAVGRNTYGKGTVQEFLGLNSLGGLKLGDIKLTVAEYTLPNGESIHKVGIKPDIMVKNTISPLVEESFAPMEFDEQYAVGDSGDAVLAVEQRLGAMGYPVGEIDGTYDQELAMGVSMFQEDEKLEASGVMDIETQIYLDNIANASKVLHDLQLDAAIQYFEEGVGKTNEEK